MTYFRTTITMPAMIFLALLIPIVLTIYAWKVTGHNIYEKNKTAFIMLAEENEQALLHRMDSYRQGLLGAVGFFKGSTFVSRDEWREYVRTLDISEQFPGIKGMGYISDVPAKKIPEFLTKMRADNAPDFTIHPENTPLNNEHFIITYISPEENNGPAVGLNIAFEENRYKAAILARDSGLPTISRHIFLIQDHEKIPAFFLLDPIYKTDAPLETITQRRAAFAGWIYAPFRGGDFLKNLTKSQGRLLNLTVYDGSSDSPDDLIFESDENKQVTRPLFSSRKKVTLLQQEWEITWTSTPEFEKTVKNQEPSHILIFGLLFTALFGAFLTVFAQRTKKIEREVEKKTRELTIEKDFSENIIEGLPVLIIGIDRNCNILFVNPATLTLTGYNKDDLLGKKFSDALLPTDEMSSFENILLQNDPATAREIFLLKKSGAKLSLSLDILPRLIGDQDIKILIGTDLSAERENFERQASFQKMQALGEMSAGLAHEINNALQPILGLSEAIKDATKEPETREMAGIINSSALGARQIVSGVLAFSRKQGAQSLSSENALDCLSECVWLAEKMLPSTVTVIKTGFSPQENTGAGRGKISANRTKLVQIFSNLFSNAAYAMQDKGTLKINCSSSEISRGHPTLLAGKYVKLEIIDTGCGMDEQTKLSAFEPFFTTKKVGSGTGLGLSIVYGIIKGWRGDVSIHSNPEQGTSITIFLPLMA